MILLENLIKTGNSPFNHRPQVKNSQEKKHVLCALNLSYTLLQKKKSRNAQMTLNALKANSQSGTITNQQTTAFF